MYTRWLFCVAVSVVTSWSCGTQRSTRSQTCLQDLRLRFRSRHHWDATVREQNTGLYGRHMRPLNLASRPRLPRELNIPVCSCSGANPFYARKQLLLSARLSHRNSVCLSVCPSVCPSQGWISQKRWRPIGQKSQILPTPSHLALSFGLTPSNLWKNFTVSATSLPGSRRWRFGDPSLHGFWLIHPCDRQTERIAMAKMRWKQ